jgi:hypothetical protein
MRDTPAWNETLCGEYEVRYDTEGGLSTALGDWPYCRGEAPRRGYEDAPVSRAAFLNSSRPSARNGLVDGHRQDTPVAPPNLH